MTYPRIRRTLLCALTSCSALTAPAVAQTSGQLPPPYLSTDEMGVNPVDGSFNFSMIEGSIGDQQDGLSMQRISGSAGWSDNWTGVLYVNSTGVSIVHGAVQEKFSKVGSNYVSAKKDGATLTVNANNDVYTYTASDGTRTTYRLPYDPGTSINVTTFSNGACRSENAIHCALPETVIRPDGYTRTLVWDTPTICTDWEECRTAKMAYRLKSVSDNRGYSMTIKYMTNGGAVPPASTWYKRQSIKFLNTKVNPCNPDLATCVGPTITYAYPSTNEMTVTDPGGREWKFTTGAGGLVAIKRPGATTDSIAVSYGINGVSSVTKDGVTTSYNRAVSGNSATMTITNALSQQTTIVSDMSLYRPTSIKDALNRTTSFAYDANGRLTETTASEGNKAIKTYDDRGNITAETLKAKPGSALTDIITTASYPTTCTNAVTCNSPIWTKDAKGNQTDYTFDPVHGGVLTVTAPADASGKRAQTRNSYVLVNGVYKLTGQSVCNTAESCVGTADETKTSIAYDANSLPTTVTTAAGDGSLSATTMATYDPVGNIKTVDGPLPGAVDTTTYRYDAGRQLTGVIAPDPDGAGSRTPTAQRVTYRPDGQVSKTEVGTVASASDADWAGYTPAQEVATSYDAKALPIKQELKAAGTTHSVTQTSYDALGRVECSATRMDPAQWGSQADACTPQPTGPNGADRVSKNVYDAAGQVTEVQSAVGTPDAATEVKASYTANGKVESVTDAENNKTSYEYDGHDRLAKTLYPVTAQGANSSSTTDTETLTYDAASNVTQFKTRDDQLITYGHDNLNRVTSKTLPSGQLWNMTYGYDLQGRLKLATGNGAYSNSFNYDALGRMTVEGNYNGTTSHAYDIAGRQTRLTWNDGFFVDYDYDAVGNVTAIRENGAVSGAGLLASYSYDNLGRRSSVSYGNGTSRGYSYDPASRLASLMVAMPAVPTSNLSQSFTYNPASQIASVTRSNDSYAWNGHANSETLSTINGLNQVVQQGSQTLNYDGRGNLISNGGASYTYNADNVLRTVSKDGVTYELTPEFTGTRLLGLRNQATGQDTRFLWSGEQLIGEIDASGGPIARRYVPGPSTDEPIVWYEGAGTTDRRYLHADERGSIVAVTNSAGGLLGINRYDEYGVPAATNIGRFGYTGQIWMPELGLYNYKARFYDPKLGRFLQTDPIGYGDGMNIYPTFSK